MISTLASNGVAHLQGIARPRGTRNRERYTFIVRAKVGTGTSNSVNTKVNKTVTVSVQNLEEPGAVSLSTVQPQEGTALYRRPW